MTGVGLNSNIGPSHGLAGHHCQGPALPSPVGQPVFPPPVFPDAGIYNPQPTLPQAQAPVNGMLPQLMQMMMMLLQMLMGRQAAPPAPVRPPVNFSNNASLQQRMQQILPPGSDPVLDYMMGVLQNTEPESPQAQQASARIAARWQQLGRPERDLKELLILQAARSLNNVTGSLFTISGNLAPESPEAQQLQARMAAINTIRQNLAQQWQQLQ